MAIAGGRSAFDGPIFVMTAMPMLPRMRSAVCVPGVLAGVLIGQTASAKQCVGLVGIELIRAGGEVIPIASGYAPYGPYAALLEPGDSIEFISIHFNCHSGVNDDVLRLEHENEEPVYHPSWQGARIRVGAPGHYFVQHESASFTFLFEGWASIDITVAPVGLVDADVPAHAWSVSYAGTGLRCTSGDWPGELLTIHDGTGRCVASFSGSNLTNSAPVSVGILRSGIYITTIRGAGGARSVRFIAP